MCRELSSGGLHTDLAARHSRPLVAGLQRFLNRCGKLVLALPNGGQPEAVLVCVEVAGSPAAVTLDEGRGPKVLQAASRAGKRLTASTRTGTGVLKRNTT